MTSVQHLPRKKNALVPDVREQVCLHDHVRWNGRIPMTGLLVCSMCGSSFANESEVERARQKVSRAVSHETADDGAFFGAIDRTWIWAASAAGAGFLAVLAWALISAWRAANG
jgi:hypothetical protein